MFQIVMNYQWPFIFNPDSGTMRFSTTNMRCLTSNSKFHGPRYLKSCKLLDHFSNSQKSIVSCFWEIIFLYNVKQSKQTTGMAVAPEQYARIGIILSDGAVPGEDSTPFASKSYSAPSLNFEKNSLEGGQFFSNCIGPPQSSDPESGPVLTYEWNWIK